MTIKEELLNAGMEEHQIDSRYSDLYVLKNDVSANWVSEYEYRQTVKLFVSDVDGLFWYEIPFGYMDEYIENKRSGGDY